MALRKKQQGSHTIYIACEGYITEREYFLAIKSEVEQKWDVRIDIYPTDPDNHNDPVNLVNKAQEKSRIYTEVWAVFDKNGHAGLQQAFTTANTPIQGKIVNIAFSSIAFEHWVLLHFEKNNTAYTKSDCKDKITGKNFYCGKPGITHPDSCNCTICVASVIRRNYINNYDKTSKLNLYSLINNRTKLALENAAWLRFKNGVTKATYPYYTYNPLTSIDFLLRNLLGECEEIIWGEINRVYSDGILDILVSYNEPLINISITNHSNNHFFVNDTNRNTYFFLSNELGQRFNLEFQDSKITLNQSQDAVKSDNHILIYKNDSLQFIFKVSEIQKPQYLNFIHNGTRNMFEL